MKAFLLTAAFLFTAHAQASFLQMAPHWDGDKYTIKNNGDENSHQVYPVAKMGDWSKEFEAVDLDAKAEYTWTMPLAEIKKRIGKGRAPLSIVIRYQDSNGYQFSIPEIKTLETAELSEEEKKTLNDVPLKASMTVGAIQNKDFNVHYELENLTDDYLSVTPKIWIPEELRLMSVEVPLMIKAHTKLNGFFQIHNESALAGSYYNLFATFEFKQKELSNFVQLMGGANVTQKSFEPPFELHVNWWAISASLFILGWLLLYRLVLVPLRKK